MWELFVLIGVAVGVMVCGVIPVLYRIHGESNPSPWTYSSIETLMEGMTEHAATQTSENVVTPNIPEFSFVVPETIVIPDRTASETSERQASVPDEEVWNSVSLLLADTQKMSIVEDVMHEEVVPFFNEQKDSQVVTDTTTVYEETVLEHTLSVDQYEAIRSNFGKSVADLITCTPVQGCTGAQVMIGTFFKDGNRLEFDQGWVELKNEFIDVINGEVIVVKGNFLANGNFFVQHWEDPMMIEAGYSSISWDNHQVQ